MSRSSNIWFSCAGFIFAHNCDDVLSISKMVNMWYESSYIKFKSQTNVLLYQCSGFHGGNYTYGNSLHPRPTRPRNLVHRCRVYPHWCTGRRYRWILLLGILLAREQTLETSFGLCLVGWQVYKIFRGKPLHLSSGLYAGPLCLYTDQLGICNSGFLFSYLEHSLKGNTTFVSKMENSRWEVKM